MNSSNNNTTTLYREIIEELKRKGTSRQDEQTLSTTHDLRTRLKIIDSSAAALALAGMCIEYYLVSSI
jgi:hypothetical protein